MNKSELIEHIAKNADINKAHATRAQKVRTQARRQHGITLVETLVALTFVAVLVSALYGHMAGRLSWGFNGTAETRCIAGYLHVVGASGTATQVLDANGKGVPRQ